MAAYNAGPWRMKPAEFKTYLPVTTANRKNVIIKGRLLYCIENTGTLIKYNGYFVIRPQLQKGWLKIIGHPFLPEANIFINEDEPFNDYKESFDKLITLLIDKKNLYFKLTDPLIKYEKHETKNRP